MPHPSLFFKALRQLGPRQLALYGLYRFGLASGHYRRLTARSPQAAPAQLEFHPLLPLPGRQALAQALGEAGCAGLIDAAGEITARQVRLFGGPPQPLRLAPAPAPLAHWTEYERGKADPAGEAGDVKFTWEPARFGWAYTLGRAYLLSGDESYAAAAWKYTEVFLDANPPYLGPHWTSAQEVALRLLAFVFILQTFAASPHSTPERVARLSRAIAAHAARIPPTLVYARSQNNNHLLSEAAGLYTAGLALPAHPAARGWRTLGWRWFNRGLASQIAADGTYVQHSANYHRLALQLALWMDSLAQAVGQPWPALSRERLAAATHWLFSILDVESGRLPNLGPNDGAYILPLTGAPFDDYRPVLHAAALAFLGHSPLASGEWDEIGLWLPASPDVKMERRRVHFRPAFQPSPRILRYPGCPSWAYLRAVHFTGRPGHADQLHLDLWHTGHNLALDPGTYQYNAPPPWDNPLAAASVHNTLTVQGQDQMLRAGRFLYLDWAQAQILTAQPNEDGSFQRLVAQHDGYRRLGLLHRREVVARPDGGWWVEDCLLPGKKPPAGVFSACLHWLVPDWPWEIEAVPAEGWGALHLDSPLGWVGLHVAGKPGKGWALGLFRAGELLYGAGPVAPVWGWYSPTYGVKVPALSLRLSVAGQAPHTLTSRWQIPG